MGAKRHCVHGNALLPTAFAAPPTPRHQGSQLFDQAAIKRILWPVFVALEALHAESILHRDVSPDKILIMPSCAPVLLVFG